MSDTECRALLDEALYATIGVVSDGAPYVTPISFVKSGDALFFRCATGQRVDALRTDLRACVTVVRFFEETGEWESVMVRGTVRFIEDDETKSEVVSLLLEKYRAYEPAMGVALPELPIDDAVTFCIAVDDMSGRNSGRSLAPRTRPGRL